VQDEQGTNYAGVAAGYVLTIDGGPVLYHAGDTNVFGDMKLIGELYRPQVAMLPIGGNYTMGCREAALAASLLESNTILPIHFGTFPEICGGSAEKLATQIGSGAEVVRRSPGEAI
jgi:L-ascorbate metabolism protein UlaG (beta-lactamase superfamily)